MEKTAARYASQPSIDIHAPMMGGMSGSGLFPHFRAGMPFPQAPQRPNPVAQQTPNYAPATTDAVLQAASKLGEDWLDVLFNDAHSPQKRADVAAGGSHDLGPKGVSTPKPHSVGPVRRARCEVSIAEYDPTHERLPVRPVEPLLPVKRSPVPRASS